MTTNTIELRGGAIPPISPSRGARISRLRCRHLGSYNGHAVTGTGWPSYYAEEHHEVAISQQALVASMICEGVFERFPTLKKVVIVEAGFAWAPPLAWRLDAQWKEMRRRGLRPRHPPSHYMRTNSAGSKPAAGR